MAKNKHAHHGGAWKVAYADFVTAMMALFLVLWLTAQDEKIKEAVERSFRNPFASVTKESTGIIPSQEKSQQAVKSTKGPSSSASMVELNMLRRINQDLVKSLQGAPEEDGMQKSVELELTPEGLRISVFDRARRPVFTADSAAFTDYGKWVFSTLAWDISRYTSFQIELEGHTEAGHQFKRDNYDSWELTADRANAARRLLLQHGVHGAQIRKVAGYSDIMPMPGKEPADESNRRVTVMLKVRPE